MGESQTHPINIPCGKNLEQVPGAHSRFVETFLSQAEISGTHIL